MIAAPFITIEAAWVFSKEEVSNSVSKVSLSSSSSSSSSSFEFSESEPGFSIIFLKSLIAFPAVDFALCEVPDSDGLGVIFDIERERELGGESWAKLLV